MLLADCMKPATETGAARLASLLDLGRSFSRLITLIRDSTALLVSGHGLDTLGEQKTGEEIESAVETLKRD